MNHQNFYVRFIIKYTDPSTTTFFLFTSIMLVTENNTDRHLCRDVTYRNTRSDKLCPCNTISFAQVNYIHAVNMTDNSLLTNIKEQECTYMNGGIKFIPIGVIRLYFYKLQCYSDPLKKVRKHVILGKYFDVKIVTLSLNVNKSPYGKINAPLNFLYTFPPAFIFYFQI